MITVALPLLKAVHIGWVALESLCRQKDTTTIPWELVIAEEQDSTLAPFGEKQILTFKPRLEAAGCKRVLYISIKDKTPIPLGEKWRILAQNADPNSTLFLLQAADCYSQPWRIVDTYNVGKDSTVDWIESQQGTFYDIKTETSVLYKDAPGQTNLNMAMRTKYMKLLPKNDRRKIVDKFIFSELTRIKGTPLKKGFNITDHWKWGMDTHGCNTISISRHTLMYGLTKCFVKNPIDVKNYIPKDILEKLRTLKTVCHN